MVRDILAIPVSTVASESAFSTTGRVLDDFHNNLSPNTVEALICTQDWFRDTSSYIAGSISKTFINFIMHYDIKIL